MSGSSKQVNESHRCEISGFHRAVDVVFPLLSCYAEYVRSSYRSFAAVLRSLKMELISCPETSVKSNKHTRTLRNDSEQ